MSQHSTGLSGHVDDDVAVSGAVRGYLVHQDVVQFEALGFRFLEDIFFQDQVVDVLVSLVLPDVAYDVYGGQISGSYRCNISFFLICHD